MALCITGPGNTHAVCKFSNMHTSSHLPSKQKALESTIRSGLTFFQLRPVETVNVPWRKPKIFNRVKFTQSVFSFFNLIYLFWFCQVSGLDQTLSLGVIHIKQQSYRDCKQQFLFFYSNLNAIITLFLLAGIQSILPLFVQFQCT